MDFTHDQRPFQSVRCDPDESLDELDGIRFGDLEMDAQSLVLR
jgi:hypothetical protein